MRGRSFSFQIIDGGRELAVTSLTSEGVRLGGEQDSSPRVVHLAFWPADDVTATLLRWSQPGSEGTRLEAVVEAGRLTFRSPTSTSLPPGRYWTQLSIAGLRLKSPKQRIDLDDSTTAVVRIETAPDPRRFTLRPLADVSVQRVVGDPGSQLDGQSVEGWLSDDRVRPSRKACLLNVLAKLRAIPTDAGRTLVDEVRHVFFADSDRVYTRVAPGFAPAMRTLLDRTRFASLGRPKADIHLRLLDTIASRNWGRATDFRLVSFREVARPSLQVVLADPVTPGVHPFADIDIDLGNPLADIRGIAIHARELLDPDTTDHLALRSDLGGSPAGPFLFYDVA